MLVAILSTGPSMSQAAADAVRHLPRIAINRAYELAPDADALCGNDAAFWNEYPEAKKFAGRKFSASQIRDVERVQPGQSTWCSAVLALEVAKTIFTADEILLLGMDFHGGHYFGKYKGRCHKTNIRWEMHRDQLSHWAKSNKGIRVTNCTIGSALTVFPIVPLDEFLERSCVAHCA